MLPSDASALAIALGANRESPAGTPTETLLAVRPLLEAELRQWAREPLGFRWSDLIDTDPVGGPPDQPRYCNAVVLVEGLNGPATERAALALLDLLQALERHFGRNRCVEQRWGPRTLDLDLLFWGEVRLDHPRLVLPHPRLHLRAFVLEPLLQAMQGAAPPRSPDRPGSEAPGRDC